MNMNHEINRLIHFGCQQGMLDKADRDYAVNLLLDLLGMDEFSWEDIEETLETATPILDNLLVYATAQGLVEDTTTMKDLFDTRIMNCLMPRPSEVLDHFKQAYALSPQKATDYFIVCQLHLTTFVRVVQTKIFALNKPIDMGLLRSQSTYLNPKRIQKR